MPPVATVAEQLSPAGPANDGRSPRPVEPRRPARPRLGELLVRDGLITPAQLQDALRVQAETTAAVPIGQILVGQKVITPEQLAAALAKYHKKSRIGDMLVETNTITEEQLELALECQEATGRRLGDVLVRLNFATEQQVKEALAKQLDVTYVDLDAVVVDPRLTNLIRRGYAEYRRVIPIALTGDRITLAMDDPTDTEAVEELGLATGCKIEVVTSTADAFARAFGRAYGEEAKPDEGQDTAAEVSNDLMRWGTPDTQAWAELRAEFEALREERDALREEREASTRALRELKARYAEATRRLAELEAAHAALRREHAAALEALNERRESPDAGARTPQEVTESLEAVLRRLKT